MLKTKVDIQVQKNNTSTEVGVAKAGIVRRATCLRAVWKHLHLLSLYLPQIQSSLPLRSLREVVEHHTSNVSSQIGYRLKFDQS